MISSFSCQCFLILDVFCSVIVRLVLLLLLLFETQTPFFSFIYLSYKCHPEEI